MGRPSSGRARAAARAAYERGSRAMVVVPGITREAGYFGRYAGSGARDDTPELKFFDVDADNTTITAGGEISGSLNLIAQGATESNRIGRKCVLRSIAMRGAIVLTGVADGAALRGGDIVRVLVYLDRQCNGAVATVTDILETASFRSFNNLANKSRFRTLMDLTTQINIKAASGTAASNDLPEVTKHIQWFKKVNLPLEFSGATGAITEIRSNNIGVLSISRAGDTTDLLLRFRMRFSDAS